MDFERNNFMDFVRNNLMGFEYFLADLLPEPSWEKLYWRQKIGGCRFFSLNEFLDV